MGNQVRASGKRFKKYGKKNVITLAQRPEIRTKFALFMSPMIKSYGLLFLETDSIGVFLNMR